MKTVLIAGGSGGIGSEIARQSSYSGWQVLIGYKNGKKRADDLVAEITKLGGNALALELDVEQPASIERALETTASKATTLNALVLSASPAPALSPFPKIEAEEFLRQFKINALGTHQLISACWKKFFYPARDGHVIGILSAAMGPPPWPHMSAYAAGKRAMQSILESAAVELASSGVRVSAVSPHYTQTPMLAALPAHVLEAALAKTKSGGFLSAAEVAQSVVKLLNHPPAAGTALAVEEISAS